MFLLKYKFDKYIASQEIIASGIFGGNCVIKVSMSDIKIKGFSIIFAKYLNENKAQIDGEDGFIMPEYDSYQVNKRIIKKRKLFQLVNEKHFLTMINQTEIVIWRFDEKEKFRYYFLAKPNLIKQFQCAIIVALLISERLAQVGEDKNIYIVLDYYQILEKTSKIQGDLSHFKILLGESNNMAALIELIEDADIQNGEIRLQQSDVKDEQVQMELMCLCDLGIARMDKENNNYIVGVELASWLLGYVSDTSDRISLESMYND